MGEKVQISCEGVKTTGVVVDIKCPAVEAYQRSVTLRSIRLKIKCVLGAVKLSALRLIKIMFFEDFILLQIFLASLSKFGTFNIK